VTLFGEYEHNKLIIDYQYVSGFRSFLNLQLATGGEAPLDDFFIGRNDFEYFKRVGEKGNWANRARLSFASNSDSEFAPFALDNQLNIRLLLSIQSIDIPCMKKDGLLSRVMLL